MIVVVAMVLATGNVAAAMAQSWAIQATPDPSAGAGSDLWGVSCPSATDCTAVGSSVNSAGVLGTLAEHWDGTSWTAQTTPNAAGAQRSGLSGVSCASTTACTAVGFYVDSAGLEVPLAEHWNGTTWAIQAAPVPAGATFSFLAGVSCPSTRVCIAVGEYFLSGSVRVALIERWNGSGWAIQPSPNPVGTRVTELFGVSCSAAVACTAVGHYVRQGASHTLAERWNGTRWAIQSTPGGAIFGILRGVSCPSNRACMAVGDYGFEPSATLAERWDGINWIIQSTPNQGPNANALLGVSCASATACTAVGDYDTANPGLFLTLAERWNGTNWKISSTPNPTGAYDIALIGASCTMRIACTAVGFATHLGGGAHFPLAERYS
jgi:hypothetical protein